MDCDLVVREAASRDRELARLVAEGRWREAAERARRLAEEAGDVEARRLLGEAAECLLDKTVVVDVPWELAELVDRILEVVEEAAERHACGLGRRLERIDGCDAVCCGSDGCVEVGRAGEDYHFAAVLLYQYVIHRIKKRIIEHQRAAASCRGELIVRGSKTQP